MSQLSYQIPDNGRKKTLLRIPESHTLYLCPGSCGRRQGIRALKNGEADHASFLTFSQADIALGDYIGMVHDAADEVLDAIEPTPRVITLYVNCIDDFIGTDGAALVEELGARHPGTRFLLSHINPVAADVRGNVAVDIHTNHYAALEPMPREERDAGVNAVGGFVSVPDSCELRGYLEALGVPVLRELVACTTFDEYSALARSRFRHTRTPGSPGSATLFSRGFLPLPAAAPRCCPTRQPPARCTPTLRVDLQAMQPFCTRKRVLWSAVTKRRRQNNWWSACQYNVT